MKFKIRMPTPATLTFNIFSHVTAMIIGILLFAPVSLAQTLDESINALASQLAEQAQAQGATNLAIAGFSELNGYESAMTDYLAEELITAFFVGGNFSIVERRELERVISEHAQYSSDLFNSETIASFGELLGVDAIVTGSVTRMGGSVRLNTRIINVETGRVVGAAAATVTIEPFVETLLNQARASSGGSEPIPGQVAQPSDVVFRNRAIQVTPVSVVMSSDRSRITITVSLRNITEKPISVGYSLKGADRSGLTNSGIDIDFGQPKGIGSSRNPTEVLPNGTTLLVLTGRISNRDISSLGDFLNLRDNWWVVTGSGASWTQVQFERIRIN